jgi:hypothetical protein
MRLTQAAGLVMLDVGSRLRRVATSGPAVALCPIGVRCTRHERKERL